MKIRQLEWGEPVQLRGGRVKMFAPGVGNALYEICFLGKSYNLMCVEESTDYCWECETLDMAKQVAQGDYENEVKNFISQHLEQE